jgi:hypothetical protein
MNATSACLLSLAFALSGDPAPKEKTGLEIGKKAPPFEFKDQSGIAQSFDDLIGEDDYLALVFFRSAQW